MNARRPPTPSTAQVLAVHRALAGAGIPHAIGGAVALAHYAPRPTPDIDVNVFVPPTRRTEVDAALAPEHLIVRKAVLDRPKDWVDIEAILIATESLDLAEIERWATRLAGLDDPRVTKLCEAAELDG